MFLSKAKQRKKIIAKSNAAPADGGNKKPRLQEFLRQRDFTGACILLEYQRQSNSGDANLLPWLAYSAFHLGDYRKALNVYNDLLKEKKCDKVYHLYAACCHFYLGDIVAAEKHADQGPACELKVRLMMHISHKQNDEEKLISYHQQLTDSTMDQLSLASVHYLRSHFQDATEVYKRFLKSQKELLALQVFVALCYYKLDYYEISLELLTPYLAVHKDSAIAINLKACNHFKLYDGKEAEQQLKVMLDLLSTSSQNFDNDLVRHNLVVFRNGENALQVLPPLLDVITEARLNMVLYHLRQGEVGEAHDLVRDYNPTTPQEYIIKAVVNAAVGQLHDNRENIELAKQYFRMVGASTSECDTIPGRQCMASCFILLRQFSEALIYLNSIKPYSHNDEIFQYNYGIALCATEEFEDAQTALLGVDSALLRNEYCWLSHLARCYIMNGKPREAWRLYLTMETKADSMAMLVLLANDFYKVGHFFFAAKAFDVLERLDFRPEFWEGRRGACCGVLQQVIAGEEKKERLGDVINLLNNNTTSPQVELIIRIMTKWLEENP